VTRAPGTRRSLAALAGAVVLVLAPFWAGTALAHANLQSSDPAANAVLDQSPTEVTLTFTEPPEISLTSVRVLDTSGGDREQGSLQADPSDRFTIRQLVETLPKGVYTVAWRAVSRADGHATAGAFAFGVQVSPADVHPTVVPGVSKSPPPSAAEIIGRWVFLVGVVLLVGGAVASLVVFEEPPGPVRTLLWIGLGAALAGVVVLGLAQRAEAGASLGVYLRTAVGRAVIWRGVALLAAGAAVVGVRLGPSRLHRVAMAAVVLAGAGAMLAEVSAGHASAARSWRWAMIGAQWAHFAAVSVWIGGLTALLVGIRGSAGQGRARAVRRFSTAAGVCLLVVAATGTVRALNEVSSFRRLFSTGYGVAVVAKIGLLLVLAGLGAANRYRNVSRAGDQPAALRRVSKVEIGVAAVALVATAILTGLSPPKAPAASPAVTVTGADFATTVKVRLEVVPGTAGPNGFTATVTDFDSGRPVRADRVSLRFAFLDAPGIGTSTLDLSPGPASGEYAGSGTNLSLSGRWTLTVLVQWGTDSVEVPLQVATPCLVRALPAAGQPTIYTADLTGGGTVQMYLDPGAVGQNEVHFTFFDATGNELPIDGQPVVTESMGQQPPTAVDARRFTAGHFIADTDLAAGRWRFQITTPATGGGPNAACFDQDVTG
jgi:copper transport protein